jgi:hypothetical protein
MSLSRNSVTPVKSSPSETSRQASALRVNDPALVASDAITSPDIHHSSALTDHVNETSDQSSSAIDTSVAQTLKALLGKFTMLADKSKPRNAIKPRIPDIFDGSDPQKLDNFIFQCSMYISARSADFPDDESRVIFALSYLSDAPLDMFRGEIIHATSIGTLPTWFTSYSEFSARLRLLFGSLDPASDAMFALESLRYRDSSRASRYTIDFNYHAPHTGWNDQALSRLYYKGLPERLKDKLSHLERPSGLHALQDLVHLLDQRYWERRLEISRDSVPYSSSASTPSSPVITPSTSALAPSSPTVIYSYIDDPQPVPSSPASSASSVSLLVSRTVSQTSPDTFRPTKHPSALSYILPTRHIPFRHFSSASARFRHLSSASAQPATVITSRPFLITSAPPSILPTFRHSAYSLDTPH